MAEFKIEKGIPLPPAGRGNGAKSRWAELEIGDSVVITKSERAAAYNHAKKRGKKFESRLVEGGARVWRTA